MPSALFRILLLLLSVSVIAACSHKSPVTPARPAYNGPGEIADIRSHPQDLNAYVGSNPQRRIIDMSSQSAQAAHWRSKFFSPWHQDTPSVRKSEVSSMLNSRARGWKNGSEKWNEADWALMRANAAIQSFPNMTAAAITTHATDVREMPTHTPRYSKPTPDPMQNTFDYFQYTRLPMGQPVLICHRSQDGAWYYVETPLVSGWVDAKDVATVSPAFEASWEGSRLGAIVREHVPLNGSEAYIGTVLPMVSTSSVYVPVAGSDGSASPRAVPVPDGTVNTMPIAMTPANFARLGNQILGQHYGWGGMLGLRDCSAMTRDLMTPFGIWLPRNSRSQGRVGYPTSLAGMSSAEKEATLQRSGVPFATLVVMNGHVVLYIGTYEGRPAIMHDLWGIRVDEPADEDQRLIIGRAVITTLTPGAEVPNLHNGRTIGESFHTMTVLGNAHK